MNQNKFDVAIVGAGPIGLSCGIEAQKRNLSHIIFDKGCLVNSVYNYPTNMVFFSSSDKIEIGNVPFISHGVKPTRTEALEYYRRVKEHWGLNVRTYEKVNSIKGSRGDFNLLTAKGRFVSNNVIIAAGFFDKANMLGIKGEDLPKVTHYYKEPHPFAGQKVIVIGGGNSAVDVALETYRCGAEVTMVILKDKLEDNVKYWVRPDIENRINEGSISCYFNSRVTEIREKDADIETPEGVLTIENDFILAMTGYHPDFEFLKNCCVEINSSGSAEPVYNPETLETSTEGMFLAGVVLGGKDTGKWFIENSLAHAQKIFDKITSK